MANPLLKILLALLGVCMFSHPSFAVSDNNVSYALKQASKGSWSHAEQIVGSTSDKTVTDVLKWYGYTQGVSGGAFQEITSFINSHPDWPYSDKIKLEAERHLNENVPDVVAIKWFDDNEPLTAYGVDRYLNALKARGQHKKVTELLGKWWPEVKLTRDQQRGFFQRYGRYLSKKMHQKRFNALLHRKDYPNAQGIANVLGNGYSELLEARKGLSKNSGNVNALIARVPASLQNNEGLLYERLKWRRQNDLNEGAIEILNKAPRSEDMDNPASWWRERHIIVRRLIEEKKYKQAYRVASSHKQKEGFPLAQAEWVSGWLALRFANQPWKAFEHFEKLYKNVSTPISKARGAYWAGRASDQLRHGQIASQWYQAASRFPETFYGQIASEQISMAEQISDNPVPYIAPGTRSKFLSEELVRAAKWFDNAGMDREASAFLLRMAKKDNKAENYVMSAELSERMGLRHTSIKIAQTLQKEKNITLDRSLYPVIVKELRNVRNVEWAFANAIIRQESRFDEQAVSSAGARGLMQLMPATAKEVASRSNIRHQTSWLTSKPSHNIALGTRYLGQMLQRFDGNYAMAAAAYNAGPRRVDRWLIEFGDPRTNEINLIDWVELIPIYETRNYVQRVLEGVHAYRKALRGKQPTPEVAIHVAAN